MQKIKKGDTVEIIAGKDINERGKVLRVIPKKKRLVIENLNLVKKHQSARQGANGQQIPAAIIDMPAPMDWSNVMLVCPSCSARTRVGFRFTDAGKKVRYCKKCDANVD